MITELHRGDEVRMGRQSLDVEAVYDQFAKRLLRYFLYRFGDYGLAEDLTAETFLTVVRKKHQFESDKGRMNGWLFQIARNKGNDYLRRQARQDRTPIQEVLTPQPQQPDPEEFITQRSLVETVLKEIEHLSPEEKEVIALRFGAGMRNLEIAQHLRISAGNVAVRLHRAVRKLKERCDEPG